VEATVQQNELVRVLQLMRGVVNDGQTNPALTGVLLKAEEACVTVSATNLDTSLRSSLSAQVKQSGAVVVNSKKLYEVVRALPDAEIYFKALPDSWVYLECGRAKFKLAGLLAEDFPTLPEVSRESGVALVGSALHDLVRRTSFAVTSRDARYYLVGALLIMEPNSLQMVATDGHQLSSARCARQGPLREPVRALIHRDALDELNQLLEGRDGEVLFQASDNQIVFSFEQTTIYTKTIDGKFPNFEKPLEAAGASDKTVVEVGCANLIDTVKRVSLLSSDSSRAILLTVDKGEVELCAVSPGTGEAREALVAQHSGVEAKLGINAHNLLQFLEVAGAEMITVKIGDPTGPIFFQPKGTDHQYLAMPMRFGRA